MTALLLVRHGQAGVFKNGFSQLLDEPDLRERYERSQATGVDKELLMTMISILLERWAAGAIEVPAESSFAAFEAQVRQGLAHVSQTLAHGVRHGSDVGMAARVDNGGH